MDAHESYDDCHEQEAPLDFKWTCDDPAARLYTYPGGIEIEGLRFGDLQLPGVIAEGIGWLIRRLLTQVPWVLPKSCTIQQRPSQFRLAWRRETWGSSITMSLFASRPSVTVGRVRAKRRPAWGPRCTANSASSRPRRPVLTVHLTFVSIPSPYRLHSTPSS